ncbi:BTAD domain-containing putative transcriptional regulator [Nonomuraea sp. NPDC050556]|uniref:BTAD domain-containing putative transcriptional regulator n=1 Tax=Nonomuraea sp. NPDC050556 TaxID=3364369 RepID=UPI0037BE1242
MTRVGILGPLQVRDHEHVAKIGGARVRVLLVRLALDPGRVITAEQLIDDLWPGEPPAHPLAALQSLVSRARREAPGLIGSHPAGYLLDVAREETDAWEFERLARAGDHRAALALWRGPALADASGHPFAMAPSARLEELRLQSLAADLATRPDPAELEELVAAHPLREPFHALLVRALAAAGRAGEALEAYERIRARLADELGADPGPELREAHLVALRIEVQGNLPARLTSFVGRKAEVVRLRELLDGDARLVTLTGPGGAGKTRLAIEVAATLDARDGVWLVELAQASGVRAAVESTLGTTDLRGSAALIVLDNCEHVVDEAAQVAERLLAEAPELRIIATSREPLDITGERLHQVGPLAGSPAVRLFTDRAAAARPDLHLDREEVLKICAELDGIPLAIELAAARLRTMPLSGLAEQLADRLALRGTRTAEPRHRTLRAVIDWSWDLLTPDEQRLLSRISVFAGGTTQAAVREVCGGDPGSLVDKSLVVLQGERYVLLETVRHYAAERLADPETAQAHARYYVELSERAEPYLRGKDQVRWLSVLDAEQANLDAALQHTADPLRAILPRFWPWVMRGRWREARTWSADVLTRVPQQEEDLAYALCVLVSGGGLLPVVWESDHPAALAAWTLAGDFGLPVDVVERARAALGRFSGHEDPWTRATVRLMAGISEFEFGAARAAEEPLAEALTGFRAAGDRWGLALALYWLSLTVENRGDFAGALALVLESAGPSAEIGGLDALPGPVMLFARIGQLRGRVGDFAGAARDLDLAWTAAERADDPLAMARVVHARAMLSRRRGAPDAQIARRALELVGLADVPPPQFVAQVLAEVSRATGEVEPLRRALALMDGNPDRTARAVILEAAAERVAPVELVGAAWALRGITGTADPEVLESLGGQRTSAREMPNPERYASSLLAGPSKPM